MKKILILAYDFPPYISVGALRPYAWYKYFYKFGFYPIIVTRQWQNKHNNTILNYISPGISDTEIVEINSTGTIIKAPYQPTLANKIMLKYGHQKYTFVRKIITAYYEIFQWFFMIGPKVSIYYAAQNYLKNYSVDVILATVDPFILLRYANKLSKEFNIPWIADYRDSWITSNFFSSIYKKLIEKKLLKTSLLVITVCDFVKSYINTNKKIHLVLNGYDPNVFSNLHTQNNNNSKLIISFSGSIKKWYPLMEFLKTYESFILNENINSIELHFYGTNINDELLKIINTQFTKIKEKIKVFPKLPNNELINKLKSSHLLLLFNEFYITATKIYDYLALQKRILFCFTESTETLKLKKRYYPYHSSQKNIFYPQEKLIKDCNAGYIIKNKEQLYQLLKKLYVEFLQEGDLKCNSKGFEKYSREYQTKILSNMINSALENKSYYQQCIRCVMDTTDPEIEFDEFGYCNHCRTFLNETKPLIEQRIKNNDLEKIFSLIKKKGKNKPYDCILGISGGSDSCYTAYLLKQHGLRVLAVHIDNGWNTDISINNVKQVVQKLGFDYEPFIIDWEQFKDLQISFLKASVPEIENPTDTAILAGLHKIAAKHGVKYIISGGNYATEGILPRLWQYNAKDLKYLKHIHKTFGKTNLKNFPLFGFWQEFYYKFFKGIRIIYPLNYINYQKQQAKQILSKELNWNDYGGKHYESHITAFVQSYILPTKFNIDYRKATFSTQICMGTMSRNEALELLKNKPYNEETIDKEIIYIANKLNLSPQELKNMLHQPPKWSYEYPNNSKMLNYTYKMYRKYFKTHK